MGKGGEFEFNSSQRLFAPAKDADELDGRSNLDRPPDLLGSCCRGEFGFSFSPVGVCWHPECGAQLGLILRASAKGRVELMCK